MSRYGRTSSRRDHHQDNPEDYRAHIELTDIPSALTEDPVVCARFILHYFINVTHAAVEDVRVASATQTQTDDELVAVPSRPLEAGEIARPVYRMTLTLRDAWERLRRASDPPPSRRGGFEEPSDTTVRWDHEIISKHVPKWCEICKVQGGGTVSSIKDRLYARKIKFRLVKVEVTEELPAKVFLRTQNGKTQGNGDRARRESQGDISTGDTPIPYSPEHESGPVHYAPFGSPKNNRPVSWDADTNAAEAASARSTAHRVDERRPEHRLTEDYVGYEIHDAETDPWHDRSWDKRKTFAEENMTWLERHRKYLLATQVQSALPQTIPGFPEGRTVVVWQLAKFMSRRHIALFFSQFGRVDDVKIRQIPEEWSPAGRIAYIAFMSIDDCQNVVKNLVGINFPKRVDGLREGNRYWKEYDDFNRLKATYLLVAEAYKGEWCPIASKLVDGKLDPTFRPIKRNPRPNPLGAPSGPRANRTGDALDYAAYESPPPPPAHASRAPAPEPRPRSREGRPRSSSRTPREDVKITLPVVFPDSVVPNKEGERSSGGPRGEGHRQLRVLALPRTVTAEELRTLMTGFGLPEKTDLAVTPNEAAVVLFNTAGAIQRAFQAAQRTKTRGEFVNCFELSLSLRDLEPKRAAVWGSWKWKDEDERRPTNGAQAPRTSGEARDAADTVEMVPTTNNENDSNADSIDAVTTMNELDAYLDSGVFPAAAKGPPLPQNSNPRPSDPVSVSARAPPRTSSNAIPVGLTRPIQHEASSSARPSVSSLSQPASNRLKRSKPKTGALAMLMAHQPDMGTPEDEAIDSPGIDGDEPAKKRRFE